MKNDAHSLAVIDIGSNSVRLFIFEIVDGKAIPTIVRKSFSGLGADLGVTGKLSPHAVAETHKRLDDFRLEINKFEIDEEIVIGTAALREAVDAEKFIQDVKRRSGFNIRIIDGEEEADYAALAILSTAQNAKGVVADFGGGSLELAYIESGQIIKKISLRLGAHYLKSNQNREEKIARYFETLPRNPDYFHHAARLYIIGGAWRSLVKARFRDKGIENPVLEGASFPKDEIIDFCRVLQKLTPQELIERFDMEVPRSKLMDVSALMLEKLVKELQPEQIVVSTAGIRDGVVYDYIKRLKNE